MDPQPPAVSAPSETANASTAETAAYGGPQSSMSADGSTSLPVALPSAEPRQSLWRRIGLLGASRRQGSDRVEGQLELIRARLDVLEEQLRSVGGALGRSTDRIGDNIRESAEQLAGDLRLELARIAERQDEQADGIGAAVRKDLASLDARLNSLDQRFASARTELEESARIGRDRIDARFNEVWEVSEQLGQITELAERLAEAREQTGELAERVRILSRSVLVLGLLVALAAGALVALQIPLQ